MITDEDIAKSLIRWRDAPRTSGSPKISLVTPSYNHGAFLKHTIRSVLDQHYPSLEYVVVDGGSRDDSKGILQTYADHLHWWVSEKDDGPESAINKGFAHTTGEIMAWIGASDKYLPWAFSAVGAIFDRFPEVDWLTTLYPVQWDTQGKVSGFHRLPPYYRDGFFRGEYQNVGNRPFARGWIQAESTFWRRSLWEKAGGFLDPGEYASDFDLWVRFYQHANLYGVAAPLAGWRLEEGQRGHGNEGAYRDSAERVLKKARKMSPKGPKPKTRPWDSLCLAMGLPLKGPVLVPTLEKGFVKTKLPIEEKPEVVSPSLFGLENYEDLSSPSG